MDSPLATVFLTVIAVTALLQAAFVGALAFGLRIGNRKIAELEELFEQTVVPQIRNLARLTDKAAALSEKSLAEVQKADAGLAEAARKTERYLDEASRRVESAVGRAAERVEVEIESRAARLQENRVVQRLSTFSAVALGLRRALEVWQASAPDGADGDEEDEETPADPSPA